MKSTPNKPADDPHDVLVVASDAVSVVPADGEISGPALDAAGRPANPHSGMKADSAAGPTVIPPVDVSFRAAAVEDVLRSARRRSIAGRVMRATVGVALAACIGA